jgi:transposase
MYYPVELRKQVIDFIDAGGSKTDASRLFNVRYNTIFTWVYKIKKYGSLENRRYSRKLSLDDLEAYAVKNPACNIAHYAKHFNVSESLIWMRFKEMGFGRGYTKRPLSK